MISTLSLVEPLRKKESSNIGMPQNLFSNMFIEATDYKNWTQRFSTGMVWVLFSLRHLLTSHNPSNVINKNKPSLYLIDIIVCPQWTGSMKNKTLSNFNVHAPCPLKMTRALADHCTINLAIGRLATKHPQYGPVWPTFPHGHRTALWLGLYRVKPGTLVKTGRLSKEGRQ